MKHALLRMVGFFSALPYAAVLLLVVTGPATWSALLYVMGMGAMVFGLATLPGGADEKVRRPRGVTRAGLLVIGIVATVRCACAGSGRSMHLSDESGGSARLVSRVLDEADVAVAGTRVLTGTGMLRDDSAELPAAMRSAYDEMRAAEGDAPSPLLGTYLGLQQPSGFDLVVVEPPAPAEHDDVALVFLHGFAGNFDLPCWQMARAVADLGIVTACPSARWTGEWETAGGEATLRRTLDLLRARGVRSFVLAGLSNGGIGASLLAPRMKGTFAGLVLVSGVDPSARPAGIPTLVLHGRRDTMTSFEAARTYAGRASARLVALDAGHFAMLVRREAADRAVHDFVRARISGRSPRVARSIE